eukprot:scaffold103984_cov63-Phaeocystis_antarctica.AAC.2
MSGIPQAPPYRHCVVCTMPGIPQEPHVDCACALPPAGAAAGRVMPPAWLQHGPLPRRADPANVRPSVRLGAEPPPSPPPSSSPAPPP